MEPMMTGRGECRESAEGGWAGREEGDGQKVRAEAGYWSVISLGWSDGSAFSPLQTSRNRTGVEALVVRFAPTERARPSSPGRALPWNRHDPFIRFRATWITLPGSPLPDSRSP